MELGNEIFGHSRGEHEIDRNVYGPLFSILRDLIDHEQCDFKINELFEYREYCWCDNQDCPQCGSLEESNFYFKPTGLKIRWYKYPMRDAYSNQSLDPESFRTMVQQCVDYLIEHDVKIRKIFESPEPDSASIISQEFQRDLAKIRLNSVNPKHASKYTILFDESSHATLTSICSVTTSQLASEKRLLDTDQEDGVR